MFQYKTILIINAYYIIIYKILINIFGTIIDIFLWVETHRTIVVKDTKYNPIPIINS